jgi:hypothetical protein
MVMVVVVAVVEEGVAAVGVTVLRSERMLSRPWTAALAMRTTTCSHLEAVA